MFKFETKINFYDCDPAGILFFARIYNLCHSAYENMIKDFNLEENYWSNDDYIVPIIHSEANYHKPLSYQDTAVIEIKVVQLKSSSFELEYECKNLKGERCVKVKTVHVFVDKKTWKKTEMKKQIYEGFSKHLQ